MLEAIFFGHAAVQPILAAQEELERRPASPSASSLPPVVNEELKGKVKALAYQKMKEAVRHQDQGERHNAIDAIADEVMAALAAEFEGRGKEIIVIHRRPGVRTGTRAHHEGRHAHRRPRHQDHQADLHRSRVSAARTRLRPLHPRRNPVHCCRHPGHLGRRAAHRLALRRHQEAVPSALQLPSVLRRRNELQACTGTSRNRPRHAGRARTAAGAPETRRLPLHHQDRLRHHRKQRLLLHGHRLRRLAFHDGRRHPAQGSGCRHRHGPHQGRRGCRHPLRHPGR